MKILVYYNICGQYATTYRKGQPMGLEMGSFFKVIDDHLYCYYRNMNSNTGG